MSNYGSMFSLHAEKSFPQSLVNRNKSDSPPPYFKMFLFFSLFIASIVLFLETFANTIPLSNLLDSNSNSILLSNSFQIETFTFPFTLNRNGYQPLSYFLANYSSYFTYAFLSDVDGIIEPHATMYLTPKSLDLTSSSHSYVFSICSESRVGECLVRDASYSTTESDSFNSKCTVFERYIVTVLETNYHHDLVANYSGVFTCMYVRREIQSLTSEDLSTTMDAMAALWRTPYSQGLAKYGPNFQNSSYFARAHDFGAAWQDSDHMHEGVGFLTQHAKITNMFEAAMQAVDPSVSLPYWDYTLEVAQGKSVNESIMFSEESFGSLTLPSTSTFGFTYRDDSILDGRIPDGRWKHMKVEDNYYPELSSAYGYMRGPWNTNPSPFISRFSTGDITLPSCKSFYSFLSDNVEMSDFLMQAELDPHATTHGGIGAIYGCDMMDEMLERGLIKSSHAQASICKQWGFVMKELYRDNYISPSEGCSYSSMDYDGIDCNITCIPESYDDLPSKMQGQLRSYTSDMEDEDWEAWRDFVCEGEAVMIFSGDHLESASPADPSFWSIHPTIERLLHAKFMAGGFPNSTWPSDPQAQYVCNKANCYQNGVKDYHDTCCLGHFENDQLFDFISGNRSAGYGLTNREMLSAMDASSSSYSVPYIFDDIEWDHCEEDFEGLFDSWVYQDLFSTTMAEENDSTSTKNKKHSKKNKSKK